MDLLALLATVPSPSWAASVPAWPFLLSYRMVPDPHPLAVAWGTRGGGLASPCSKGAQQEEMG